MRIASPSANRASAMRIASPSANRASVRLGLSTIESDLRSLFRVRWRRGTMNQETAPPASERDEQEIRELMDRLSDSWARGDAQGYGAEFTEDCDYIAFDGTRFRGPTEPQT